MRRSSPLVVQVTGLLPSTSNGDPSPFWMDLHAAAYLALLHFNSRNATVVPSLADSRCNVQLSYRAYDSEFSVFAALKKLSNEILYHPHTEKPLAVLGAMRSAVSRPVSILAGAAETMTVSPTSTSALLDNTDSFPYFTRLIPTNRGDAKALVRYYDSLGITHFGVIYIQDGVSKR